MIILIQITATFGEIQPGVRFAIFSVSPSCMPYEQEAESVSLLMKWAPYLLFASPSCMRVRDNVVLSISSVYLETSLISSHTSGPVLWYQIPPAR